MIKYLVSGAIAALITRGTVLYYREKNRCVCSWCGYNRKHGRNGHADWEDWGCADCVPGLVYTEVGCEPYMRCQICGWDYRLPITWEFSPQPPEWSHFGRMFHAQ